MVFCESLILRDLRLLGMGRSVAEMRQIFQRTGALGEFLRHVLSSVYAVLEEVTILA